MKVISAFAHFWEQETALVAPTLMMKIFPPRVLLPVAVLGAVGIVLVSLRAEAADSSAAMAGMEARSPFVGQPAPNWTLKDLAGNPVSFSQFKGKVVVVDFWATWCGPCVSEIPGYVALQKKYGKDGLVIVGMSVDTKKPSAVKDFAEKHGMTYQIVMADDTVLQAFGSPEAIPTTFLIGRDGKVLHQKVGAWSHEDYEKLVEKAL